MPSDMSVSFARKPTKLRVVEMAARNMSRFCDEGEARSEGGRGVGEGWKMEKRVGWSIQHWKQAIKSMSFPAIQFARHIAQFHIQFYGRTTTTPIYFTAANPLFPRRPFADFTRFTVPRFCLYSPPCVFFLFLQNNSSLSTLTWSVNKGRTVFTKGEVFYKKIHKRDDRTISFFFVMIDRGWMVVENGM